MKLLMKLFIYLAIMAIIGIFSSFTTVQCQSHADLVDFMKINEPPEKIPKFEFIASRIRRNIDPRAIDEDNISKDEVNEESRLRIRREAPFEDSKKPKEFEQINSNLRAKRQMPSPPVEIPMPPM